MPQYTLTHPDHPTTSHHISLFYIHSSPTLPHLISQVIQNTIPETIILIDSTRVLSVAHVECAVYNALFKTKGQKRLKTIQTQILYNLSESKNFSQSLTRFGAKEHECFLVAIDSDVDTAKIREWIGNDGEIVEGLREMEGFLEKNGSEQWVRENLFGASTEMAKTASKRHLESILLTQLSVKDL